MSSGLITALGIAGVIVLLLVLWFAIRPHRKKLRQPVRGTLNVVSASQVPHDASYSNYRLQGVISGPGIQPTPVTKTGIASTKKWPTPGCVLPVEFEAGNPTTFNILWDEVPSGTALGAQAAALLAQQMANGGRPLQAEGILDLTGGVTPAGATGVMVNGQQVDPNVVGGAIPGANILTQGLTGQAEVQSVQQTGHPAGTLGEFRVNVVVTPDQAGLVPYQAYFDAAFRPESARRKEFLCRVGAQFPVRFDAQAPQLVTPDPARMPAGSGF